MRVDDHNKWIALCAAVSFGWWMHSISAGLTALFVLTLWRLNRRTR